MKIYNESSNSNVPINVPLNVSINVPKKLTKVQERVYIELVNNNSITRQKISTRIGVTIKTVSRAIDDLKKLKLIKRVGSNKTGHWEIIEI